MLPLALGSVLELLVMASIIVLDLEAKLPLFLLQAYVIPLVGIMPKVVIWVFLVSPTLVTLFVA